MNDHYSPEFITAQREALVEKKINLEKEISTVATWDEGQGQYVPKYEEFNKGDTEQEDEAAEETTVLGENTATADSLIISLNEVLAALTKMDAGNYGDCDNCGEFIHEDRLLIYPAAQTCIKCEK